MNSIAPNDRFRIINTPFKDWNGQEGVIVAINPSGSAEIQLDNPVKGHVLGFGELETANFNIDLEYIEKLTGLTGLNESNGVVMDKRQKFENFLESLKGKDQDTLIESVKKGFQVCLNSIIN